MATDFNATVEAQDEEVPNSVLLQTKEPTAGTSFQVRTMYQFKASLVFQLLTQRPN